MADKTLSEKTLSKEELERQEAEQLPDREAMSTINPCVYPEPIVPIDEGPFPTDPFPTK